MKPQNHQESVNQVAIIINALGAVKTIIPNEGTPMTATVTIWTDEEIELLKGEVIKLIKG